MKSAPKLLIAFQYYFKALFITTIRPNTDWSRIRSITTSLLMPWVSQEPTKLSRTSSLQKENLWFKRFTEASCQISFVSKVRTSFPWPMFICRPLKGLDCYDSSSSSDSSILKVCFHLPVLHLNRLWRRTLIYMNLTLSMISYTQNCQLFIIPVRNN